MYGRINQRKLKEQDYILSCQRARQQLDDYIDMEAKRVNIDSAKKRAVLQNMDYEGFRQMVLGANIFATKSTELYSFSKGQNKETITNRLFKEDEEGVQESSTDKQSLESGSNRSVQVSLKTKQLEHQEEVITRAQGKSELQCTSFRQFKKKFIQHYPKGVDKEPLTQDNVQHLYLLLQNQDQQRLTKIFNMDCEANILLRIVDVFDYVVKYLQEKQRPIVKEMAFMLKFFQTVLSLKNMREFNLSILSKKQKSKIALFLEEGKGYLVRRGQISRNTVEKQKHPNTQGDKIQNMQKQEDFKSGKLKENQQDQQSIDEEQDVKALEQLIKGLKK